MPLLSVLAVVLDIGRGAGDIRDLLLRPWRDGLIELELRNGSLIRTGDALVGGV